MNNRENECTSQGTCIYRGVVTSLYKKYCRPIPVGLLGFSDGLVTTNLRYVPRIKGLSSLGFQVRYPSDIAFLNDRIKNVCRLEEKPSRQPYQLA